MYRTITVFSSEYQLYDIIANISVILVFIYNFLYLKQRKALLGKRALVLLYTKNNYRNNLPGFFKNETFFASVETIILTLPLGLSIAIFNQMVGELLTDGNANYFGNLFFYPIVFFVVCFLIKTDYFANLDLYITALPFALFFAKLACFFEGCCAGIETTRFGMYNHYYEKTMFPVQLVEAAFALALFLFLYLYRKKAKKGTLFPLYLIFYSLTRFFSEFLRMEPAYLGILKKYQILCIIGFVLGIAELVLTLKFADKVSEFFEVRYNRYEEKIKVKLHKKYKKQIRKPVVHHKRTK